MRGHLQQVGRQLVGVSDCVVGWLLAVVATAIYLLTLEPTTSFWDCGEFISISYNLQVGHPPGAPFYQLLAHVFSWLAGGNVMAVARCCNALSAVAGGLTVMFLYWSILLLGRMCKGDRPTALRVGALVGSLCYLFCDTAWFSAVESEVYALAMLVASVTLWAMLRWYHSADRREAQRWLLLVALLIGLGVCTHLLTLLTTPVLLLLFLYRAREVRQAGLHVRHLTVPLLLSLLLFFAIGLSPYLIVPIRAAADTPINQCHSGSWEDVKSYLGRDQYEKAPLYPRMWRHRENDALYAAGWNGGDTNFVGNLRYYGSYQLTYMYLRYLMWNFSGRYNDRQGFGSPQNGQFITGFSIIDRMLVGTGKRLPDSLPTRGHNVYYLLPLLLGLLGFAFLSDDRRVFWLVTTLFLMGGIVLSLYLNHPCYEPRERDYAYILSFYAFCICIGYGACWAMSQGVAWLARFCGRCTARVTFLLIVLAVPTLLACQNWDDHDRRGRYVARDAGANILNSCDHDKQGAVLFCYGDNDTFPLWYLQTVEKERLDVRVENIGLMGWSAFLQLLRECETTRRPVYFTHYAYNQYHERFNGRLQLEGNAYRLMPEVSTDSVAAEPAYRHIMQNMRWHSLKGVYVDETCCKFLEQYWSDVVLVAENLSSRGDTTKASEVLEKTMSEIPLTEIQKVELVSAIAEAYDHAGNCQRGAAVRSYLRNILTEQLAYYHSMPRRRQAGMPYTLTPREELMKALLEEPHR